MLTDGTVITDEIFDRIVTNAVKMVKDAAPNPSTRGKTSRGNLANNAVQKRVDRQNMHIEIYVDVNEAPYMPYVTKKTHWSDGRPYEYNEWFDKVAGEVAEYIADLLGGKVIKS